MSDHAACAPARAAQDHDSAACYPAERPLIAKAAEYAGHAQNGPGKCLNEGGKRL